jgi:hypothetical protein
MTDVILTPDGGHDAAALCEQAAARLAAHAQTATAFTDALHDGWLGDCEEGRGWALLLHDKAVGENSLRWLIDRHVANLTAIADQFRRTTRPYGDTDSTVIGPQWSSG